MVTVCKQPEIDCTEEDCKLVSTAYLVDETMHTWLAETFLLHLSILQVNCCVL